MKSVSQGRKPNYYQQMQFVPLATLTKYSCRTSSVILMNIATLYYSV